MGRLRALVADVANTPQRPAPMLYIVRPGDTLTGIAERFGATAQMLARANGIENPDLIFAGQTLDLPGTSGALPGSPVRGGSTPPPGIRHRNYLDRVDAPLKGDPMSRDPVTYDNVIDQFAVESNPRYRRQDNDTYCNIFVWDVTYAMGAEIPHLVAGNGEPVSVYEGAWLSANGMNRWLAENGPRYGWREVAAAEAQNLANLGHPAVASVYNETEADPYHPEPVGHMGIVRPGEMRNGPTHAQAGIYNFNRAHVYECFPADGTRFFVNDTGRTIGEPGTPAGRQMSPVSVEEQMPGWGR